MDTFEAPKIDPKLFVTCRLCLEELGQYQIVPIIQQQIKYCYDIIVEPFDGLPQLICIKCKENLLHSYTLKKILCEKQTNLRKKMCKNLTYDVCIQPQQDPVSSSQQTSETIERTSLLSSQNKEKAEIATTKTKKSILASDSEDSHTTNKSERRKRAFSSSCTHFKWEGAEYKRKIICTICNSEWSNLKSYASHSRKHTVLKDQYSSVLNKFCSVRLQKIDDKPNMTGKNNMVVHSSDKIIQNCHCLYYIKYCKETNYASGSQKSSKYSEAEKTYSTDSDEEIVMNSKARKRRILSRSSNDTLVIETNSNKVISDTEEDIKMGKQECEVQSASTTSNQCISIDDSSEDEEERCPTETVHKVRQPMEAKVADQSVIKQIISTCVSTYLKKHGSNDKELNIESQLKRKVLSIGRKVINRQGFNWTGLLKYLEHKNLDIIWITKAIPNKESDYVRIMTKLRGADKTEDNLGWEPVVVSQVEAKKLSTVVGSDLSSSKSRVTTSEVESQNSSQLSMPTLEKSNMLTSQDSAVLLVCNLPDPRNKLLNANPVANPKQLPRKTGIGSELRLNKSSVDLFHTNENNELLMPIITSTTSLAVPATAEQQQQNVNQVTVTNTTAPVARIKVKPASELMSERVLHSLRNEQLPSENKTNKIENANMIVNHIDNTNSTIQKPNIWYPQSVSNVYVPNIGPQIAVGNQPVQVVIGPPPTYKPIAPSSPLLLNNADLRDEYVLLNTVDLPNTKTNSPFNYLKSLLQIHKLILLDSHETLSLEFICLIKFKVQFKQEPMDDTVILCLSLFNLKNMFCFTVKNREQRDINMNKISANWQWEILNIFRGELVEKLLKNAQKHSQETHDYTNKFLCVLKSISMNKLS